MASAGFIDGQPIPFRIAVQSPIGFEPTNGIRDYAGMDYVRSNITFLRGRRSIKEIGEASGAGQSWLQRFMKPDQPSGIQKPNAEKLALVAKELGVSFSALMTQDLTRAGGAPSQSAGQDRATMRAAARLIERAREMIIGDVDEDALIDNALEAAIEIGPERILSGDGLFDGVRLVAARIKSA
jgi:hypothetical protein